MALIASTSNETTIFDSFSPAIIGISDNLTLWMVVSYFRFSASTLTQFVPSLNRLIWVLDFGDRPATLTVSGTILPIVGLAYNPDVSLSNFLYSYIVNKFSTKGTPCSVTIGGIGFTGFLIGANLEAQSRSDSVIQCALDFTLL